MLLQMTDRVEGSVEGSCACGSVRFSTTNEAWGAFICHCSMCPKRDRTYTDTLLGAGAVWVALPRVRVAAEHAGALQIVQTSDFGQRARCSLCDSALWIRYQAEVHTDWCHLDALRSVFSLGLGDGGPASVTSLRHNAFHIHCAENGHGDDGLRAFKGFDPWEPDPCRPGGAARPDICARCFLLRAADSGTGSVPAALSTAAYCQCAVKQDVPPIYAVPTEFCKHASLLPLRAVR